MQDDQDFKQMSAQQALQLVVYFLDTAFNTPKECLLSLKQSDDVSDQTMLMVNANLLFW